MVVLFIHSGLLSALQERENRHSTLFAGQQAWKLLPYALLGKHERAFQHLVPRLEDADVAFELRSRGDDALPSPLLLAIAMSDEALVRRFARIPQFLDHAFEDAWGQRMTPLCLAVTKDNAVAVVRCLVDAGADMFQDCRVRPDDEWLATFWRRSGLRLTVGGVLEGEDRRLEEWVAAKMLVG
ncbi:hypothetical protein NpPPO83_00011135 [Neofusicoccum parvum]|uniref:Uncharacterized protein n=1 Tax=Neofusicoccum parvum TaxID=310453 RepID=A0ACB5SEW1_9PEZI|nr:hypothetical protein NpPPO83_00011135 [Neofusicoccum parvum]